MGRTAKEIIADIRVVRWDNKKLYKEMRALVEEGEDTTLWLIAAAYAIDPEEAKHIHRQIAVNDETILALTRELCDDPREYPFDCERGRPT